MCNNDHNHLPIGRIKQPDGSYKWDTADEAAYGIELCRKIVQIVQAALQLWISYGLKDIRLKLAMSPPTKEAKLPYTNNRAGDARELVHPCDQYHALPDKMLEVIYMLLSTAPNAIANYRAQCVQAWVGWAAKLETEEKLHKLSLEICNPVRRNTLETSMLILRGRAASSSANVQIVWQAWDIVRCDFAWQAQHLVQIRRAWQVILCGRCSIQYALSGLRQVVQACKSCGRRRGTL
eukprot:s181_g47.t1